MKSKLKTTNIRTSSSTDEIISNSRQFVEIPIILPIKPSFKVDDCSSEKNNMQPSSSKDNPIETSIVTRTALAKSAFLQGTPVHNFSSASIDDSDNEPVASIRVPLLKSTYVETPSSTDEQSSSCSKTSFHELQESDGEFSEKSIDIPHTKLDSSQSPPLQTEKKIIPEITIHKKTNRHAPTLSRFRRIESEIDPFDKDKLTPQIEYSSCEYLLHDFDKAEVPETVSPTNSIFPTQERRTSSKSLKIPTTNDVNIEITSKSSPKTSPEASNGKEPTRFWLTRTMSKMLDDKSKPSTSNSSTPTEQKKRSKSPSSLIEFAQRKLPKWASFIKKSEEDCESQSKTSSPSSSKLKRNVVSEKSRSAEEYDRRNKFIPPKPHSSEEYDRETRYKGILRRKAVEDSVDVVDTDKLVSPSSSKGIRKSPEIIEPRSSNRLYAFPFLGRSKEKKDFKSDIKLKHKLGDPDTSNSLMSSRDLEKIESGNRRSQSELRSKKSHKSESKQTSFEEKTKSFFKQKSRDKSNESSRKNSVNQYQSTLKEKYTKWTKNVKKESVKAISAETLEGMGTAVEGLVQGEFLAASMKIFLVVSPPFARFPIRSRSLSNLDALDSRRMRLLDNHFMARMVFGVRPSSLPLSYSSMPDITANNYTTPRKIESLLHKCTRGIAYHPGPTRRRSAFVRHTRTNLRRANSLSSCRDFFQLTLPASFETSESIDDRTSENRRLLSNIVFVPAIGNVSLRRAAQNAFERRRSLGPVSIAEFSARINGSRQLFNTETIDTGRLGGAHVTLHDTSKQRMLRKASFEGLPKSTESGRMSSPASTHKDSKTPLSQKLKWSNIFRSKENTANMEKLSTILNKFTRRLPNLPAEMQVEFNVDRARRALNHIVGVPFENLIDNSSFTPDEERIQRSIYEIISTEAEYIDNIRTVCEVFLSVAVQIQKNNLMMEVNLDHLFLNIVEVLQCNVLFWETTFYPMLVDCFLHKDNWLNPKNNIIRRDKNVYSSKFNPILMYSGFSLFNEIFHRYQNYVENQNRSQAYSKQLVQESPLYVAYLTWCEAHKRCKRLRLSDLLVKPMQRLTKYGLLLSALYDFINLEPEKHAVKNTYRFCRKFAFDLNCHIRYTEEVDRMNKMVEVIESFDGVDTKDDEVDVYLKLHTNLRLKEPITVNSVEYHRAIILEGDVKYKDAKDKLEVHAVLFTDFLLILVPSKRKKSLYKAIRPKLMVAHMYVYPQYYIKEGNKDLSSIIVINVDATGTANGYFTLYESTSNKDAQQPSLKSWLFAIREAQVTMEAIVRMVHDPREAYYDIESTNNHAAESERAQRIKHNSTDEDGTILEPMEALMPAVVAAADKRLCTMMQGTEAPKEGSGALALEITAFPDGPSSLRSLSFNSSLQRSYSGTCNDWEIIGTLRGGSGDTSAGRRTISLSSEEGPTASMLCDTAGDTRPPVIVTHSPKTSHSSKCFAGQQMIATIEPVAHCSKNPPQVVTKIVRTPVTTKINVMASTKHSQKLNTLTVEPINLRQSMPNLSVPIVAVCTRNSLNVPSHSSRRAPKAGNTDRQQFLSPDTRGISYPPPSTSRASLRRAFAFSSAGHPI